MKAFAELSPRGDRIDVHFRYDPATKEAVKNIPGARFVGRDSGGPLWRLPLDLDSGRELREVFGDGLTLGGALLAWGREQVQKERNLASLVRADDAELHRVPERLARAIAGEPIPELNLPPLPNGRPHPLMTKRDSRPYQRADIAMMAATNVLNANQPGTGKTLEAIGAAFEAGLDDGPHLVVNLVTAHFDPWVVELERFQPLPVLWGKGPDERREAILLAEDWAREGRAFWLIVGYDDIRTFRDKTQLKVREGDKAVYPAVPRHPALCRINFKTVTIDEFHKSGLPNPNVKSKTMFQRGLAQIKAERRFAMSGTPMGGKPIRLWPVLNWLEPSAYPAKWTWIDKWLEVDDSSGYGKKVGGIRPGLEDRFYESHAKHMVRRMKREALPGLPDQVHEVVYVEMTPRQRKQYDKFARDAEVAIEDGRISATNVLAEYTRLKQFANARQELHDGKPYPTDDSGKLPVLLQRLEEQGIRKDDPEPGARAIVASESRRFVEVVVAYLEEHGIAAAELSGAVKQGDERTGIISWFKEAAEEPRVIVMTTQTGGVSLNLEEAGSAHILDETWNPDDQEQFADRADRGSRTTPLVVYTYRTKDSIQEYIAEVSEGKAITNRDLLDLRRQGFRASMTSP